MSGVTLVKKVKEYFPGAISIKRLEYEVTRILKNHDIMPEKTLLAISSCADELERRLEKQFDKEWSLGFLFGGLAGFPFVGITGTNACLHHVPKNGNLFLIYCSHVGISENGIIGSIERRGMDHLGTCCGSAIYAYENKRPSNKAMDYQEDYVIDKVNNHRNQFGCDKQKNMVLLPNIIRHEIKKDISELMKLAKIPVVLLGGININTKEKDYFEVYQFGIMVSGKFLDLRCELNLEINK